MSTLRIEREYRAPAEAVFDAWTSEEVMRRWRHAEHDWETCVAEGGGVYTEIDPPRRLAFTWLWDGSTRRQLIEIELEEADAVTTVRFTHRGLWDQEAVRSHGGGWGTAFDNLARTLDSQEAR